jgi:N6-adenosine-specific RNA methylase IME4
MEFHEIANLFPMMQPDELSDLVDDIKQNGLIEPIVLYEEKILDGRNRYLACGEAGVKPHYEYYKGDEPVSYVVSKNLHRRHLNKSQEAGVAWKAKPMLAKEARKRMTAGINQYSSPVELIPEGEKGRSRDAAGDMFGVSGRYVDEFGKIEQEAPEYVEPIMQGEITITKAKREIAKEKRKNMPKPELPIGTYEVIYADPPWSYDNSGFTQSAASQYPTMSIEEICNLDVSALTNNRSVLFMWATSPLLPEAFEVIKAWGFEYKASMVWIKDRSPGMGWWVNTKHELLLMASKPSAEKVNHPAKKFDSVITAPVTRHSAKPDVFYKLIEEMYDGTKIELFARNKREGWDNWGNENV